jgi:PIN domain nuclease of toxin-antitoxin system
MRLLLDTHMVLAILRRDVGQRFPDVPELLADPDTVSFASIASLWEIAVKTRLGKLDPGMPLNEIAPSLDAIGLSLLGIEISHVITAAEPEPNTRDPFDRLLLSQCQIENLKLLTVDRALADHPHAFKF